MNTSQQGHWYTAYAASYKGQRIVFCGTCTTCFIFLGLALTFPGAIMTGFVYRKPSPPFDDPFFTRNDANNPLRIAGPVLLTIGLVFIIVSTISCCVISARVSSGRRQVGRVLQDNNQMRNEDFVQPSNVYPQQPQAQYASTSPYGSEDTVHPSPYPQQPQVSHTSTLPYPYHYNAPPSYHPYLSDITYQPPPYDSQFGTVSYNPIEVQVNKPHGNTNTAYVVPIATGPNISGAHPYSAPQTK